MPPSKTMYEEILAPLLPFLPGIRKLVRDHGPNAIDVLLDDFRARRIDPSLVGTLSHALVVAHLERAMDRAPSYTDLSAVAKDPDLRHQAEVKMDLRNVPENERLPLFIRDVTLNWILLAFARAGRQEYEVSPGLATKLAHTELRGLLAEDLQLPHPALSIQVPPEAGIVTTGPYGAVPVEEFYIVEGANPVRNWRIYIRTAGGQSLDAPAQDLRFTILLPDGQSLDECIALTTDIQALVAIDGLPDTLIHGEHNTTQSHSAPGDLAQWTDLFRWAMNVVLYATNNGLRQEIWRNADAVKLRDRLARTPQSTKREKLRAELRALDKQRRIILGPDVKLEVLDGGSGAPLTVRVRVQGHWKRQAFGPKKSERKIIWIEPYWRGPDDAPPPTSTRHTLV